MFHRARSDLDGPPFALPALVDRASEAWWRARPRTRVLLGASAVVLLALAALGKAASEPHGPPTGVWMATRDLVVGEPLSERDLERATVPSDLVPDGALADAVGTLAAPLPRGAIATDRHLGDAGVGAGLPDGMVAVPVPVELFPGLPVGARIDLVAGDLGGGSHLLTSGAIVLHDDDLATWLAVERASAGDVAAATLQGPIGVVVLPDDAS